MSSRLLLVGELVVDVTLQTQVAPTKVRMGGVFHAVRGAWACGQDTDLAYFGPAYLDREAEGMAQVHGVARVEKIGDITGTPNVMLIAEPTEAGTQGYEHVLSEHASHTFNATKLCGLASDNSDVLVLCGNFDVGPVLEALAGTGARVHLDLGSGPSQLDKLSRLGRPLATLILSTSSPCFADIASDVPGNLARLLDAGAEKVVLKENRGGARQVSRQGAIEVGSQRRDIVHSIGVGDVFNVVCVAFQPVVGDVAALTYASWIAAEYAATTFPDDFRRETARALQLPPDVIAALPSVRLPWEARPSHQIYIAAPDFDYVDRRPIDRLVDCLKYHNFSVRLPVREHGQASERMSAEEKAALYRKDLELLEQCRLLIAVNLYNDPGTMIEIGVAHAKGMPIIVYDPFSRAENVMLVSAPELVSDSLDKVITATYDAVARASAR